MARQINKEALKGALKAIEHSAGSPRGQMVGFTMDQVDALKRLLKSSVSEACTNNMERNDA